MVDLIQIGQFASECLTDCLMPEANPKQRLGWGVLPDKGQQDTGFLRYPRPWGKQNAFIAPHLSQLNLIVPENIHLLTKYFFGKVNQVVSEGIVIIQYKQFFHSI
jgi:hypothetical protein